MSKIISKPFDKSKKILRAIFRGSPNLFTTSDLNRQIEAFEDRIKNIESRMYSGVFSDATLAVGANSNLEVRLTYLNLWGAPLQSSGTLITIPLGVSSRTYGGSVYLWYTTKVVTYADDTTHEISGAKFEDGTSKEAADHLVINEWGIVPYMELPEGANAIELFTEVYPGSLGVKMFAPVGLNLMYESHKVQEEIGTVKQDTNRIKTSLEVKRYYGVWDVSVAGPFQSTARIMVIFTKNFGYVHLKLEAIGSITGNNASLKFSDLTDYTSKCNCTKDEALQWLREAISFDYFTNIDNFLAGVKNTTVDLTTAEFSFALLAEDVKFLFSFTNEASSISLQFKIPFIKE